MFAQTSNLVPIWALAALVLAFTIKHFIADFLFQTSWIARGKEAREGWLAPLSAHAGGHGALTLLITLAVAPRLWWMGPADFVVHFAVDRGKALAAQRMGATPQDAGFWRLLGLDQMLHQVTNVALAVGLLIL